MKEYLSHLSALLHYNILLPDTMFGEEDVLSRSNKQIIDITVDDPHRRSHHEEHLSHSCRLPLPRGAVVKKGDIFISSPELIFLQFAKELDIQRLILLGLQMCARPFDTAYENLTTKRKLKAFLEKTSGHDGHQKAERAMRYIEDGSASIMESLLFMLLTLPYKLGGYGFNGMEFNHEILLDQKARRLLNQKHCYVDIYHEKSKVGIEYDSLEHHNDAKSQGKDSVRASALKRLGIDMIQVTTIQIYDKSAFEDVVARLARSIGKRLKNNVPGFHEAHSTLRKLM